MKNATNSRQIFPALKFPAKFGLGDDRRKNVSYPKIAGKFWDGLPGGGGRKKQDKLPNFSDPKFPGNFEFQNYLKISEYNPRIPIPNFSGNFVRTKFPRLQNYLKISEYNPELLFQISREIS